MKAGLATSAVLHAALIGFGLITLSAPRPLQVADVESFPIDIVPIDELTQIQQGDKKAPKKEKSNPVQTKKPSLVREAKAVGDADVDTDKKPTPEPKPRPVDAKTAPAPSPEPKPRPDADVAKEPVKPTEEKTASVPATEVAPAPEPKQEVKPDPVAETITADQPDAETAALPESAPTPQARPKPPEATTAKAPDHKDAEKPVVKEAAKPKSEESEFNADEVAALLSKEKPTGGGARRSSDEASFGADKKTGDQQQPTQSEKDALIRQLEGCWNIPVGAEDSDGLRATIGFDLTSGKLTGMPVIEQSSGNQAFDESAIRAVLKCDRDGLMIPADRPEVWNRVVVNFSPTDMF